MQFGKEVPHCRPRVWVRLPLSFTIETDNFYNNMLNVWKQGCTTQTYRKPYDLLLLVRTTTWYELYQDFLQSHRMILRFHDLFVQILPISKPLATAESDSCDRGWQNPQEHTRSWRTNPLVYFLKLPLQPSTQLDFFNTQLNIISNRLIQFNKDVWFSLLLLNVRWLRRWWRWRNQKLLVAHNCFAHNLLCCSIF